MSAFGQAVPREPTPRASYDDKADTLYCSLYSPPKAATITLEATAAVLFRFDDDGLIGVTITDFGEQAASAITAPSPTPAGEGLIEQQARTLLAAEYEADGFTDFAAQARGEAYCPQAVVAPAIRAVQRALSASTPATGEDAAQRLQDHMEQHHGVCLQASEWDAAIRAITGEDDHGR